MKNILKQLYSGQIKPIEHSGTATPFLNKKILDMETDFKNTLTNAQIEQYEAIMDEQLKLYSYEFEQEFIYGFKLGANLMCEVFLNPQDIPDSTDKDS